MTRYSPPPDSPYRRFRLGSSRPFRVLWNGNDVPRDAEKMEEEIGCRGAELGAGYAVASPSRSEPGVFDVEYRFPGGNRERVAEKFDTPSYKKFMENFGLRVLKTGDNGK